MTPAEKRWLAQLAAGKSVAQIAKAEKFSVGTMRVYLHKLYKSMGVHNRAQAVAKSSYKSPREWTRMQDAERRHIATLRKCIFDLRAFMDEVGDDGMPNESDAPMDHARKVLFSPVVTKALKALEPI